MTCRIRAVEHRKCVAEPAGAHPGLQDRILQNYTRIEYAHEVRKKTFNFSLCIEVQKLVWYGLIMHFCDSNHETTRSSKRKYNHIKDH